MISTGGAPPRGKDDPLSELDIDELVERLTPGEIQKLLDECDPDDPHIPPSLRTNYKVLTLRLIIPLSLHSLNRILPCYILTCSSNIFIDSARSKQLVP